MKASGVDMATVVVAGIDATQDDAFHQLQICDNGVGIATEHQHAIFGMFNRLHNRRQYDGTGLGLAICQRLVNAMDGSIRVQSASGEGALFTVHLPLHTGPAPAAPALRPDLGGLRCTWQGLHAHGIDDWSAYLRAAGAAVARDPQAGDGGAGDDTVVVRIEVDASDRPMPPCTVVLRRGQRRSPQRDALGQVLLDADALHRDALVLAVAMAADQHAMPADAVACRFIDAQQRVPVPAITAGSNQSKSTVR